MRSKWITHNGIKIFYQDFSGHDISDAEAVKEELVEVQAVVLQEPANSILVLSDFRETQIGKDLLDLMTTSSRVTKSRIKKTAVIGVTGTKRILLNMLLSITGQQVSLFDTFEGAQEWLTQA
jgi:hypothetical protein